MHNVMALERGQLIAEVLESVRDLHPNAYATKIDEVLSAKHKRLTMLPQVHTALTRLAKKGLVAVAGSDVGEHRRRPRTLYVLTDTGFAALKARSAGLGHGRMSGYEVSA